LLPEAHWINADVFDWRTLGLGRYDVAIANPPFGRSNVQATRRAIAAPSLNCKF
jgi:tRNA1(Val) A37 N6-methylase TrmN6